MNKLDEDSIVKYHTDDEKKELLEKEEVIFNKEARNETRNNKANAKKS